MVTIKFTKKEQNEIREALDAVLVDLRSLLKLSQSDQLTCVFHLEEDHSKDYCLCVKQDVTCFCERASSEKMILENVKGMIKRPPIADFNLIFRFLKEYENIRKDLEKQAIESNKYKENGLERIREIKEQYKKEATIELELPATNNQHTIEVTEEEGRTIGKIKLGHGTIKIITKGNIVLVSEAEKEKTKSKMKT